MHIRSRTLLFAAAAAALVLGVPLVAVAGGGEADGTDAPTRSPAALVIGVDQVAEGAAVYERACASCHGVRLEGFAHFPPLVGGAFRDRWSDRPIGELHTYVVEQMPLGAGGTLSDDAYAAVVAFMLERNGFEPGAVPFDPDDAAVLELELTFGD